MELIDIVKRVKRRLVFPGSSESGIKIAGYRHIDCLFDKKAKLESLIAYAETFNPDIIFNIGGIAEEAECLGATLNYSDDEDPSIAEPLISSLKDVERLKIPSPKKGKLTSISLAVIPELSKKFKGKFIPASVTGPFTLAALLAGAEKFSLTLKKERDLAFALLDKCTSFLFEYAKEQISLGANYFTVAEPSAIFLSNEDFKLFCLPYLKKLFKNFKKYPSHIHICGDSFHLLHTLTRCGAHGLSLDSMVDLEDAARLIPQNIVLIGNIDPVSIITESTEENVKRETQTLLNKMELFENFILATACSIPADAPLENIAAFIETGRKYKILNKEVQNALKECADRVYSGNNRNLRETLKKALKYKISAQNIYSKGLARGIKWISDDYNKHRVSIPHILLSVETMEKAVRLLWKNKKSFKTKRKRLLIGTVKGDIHEIGKNLVKTMFESKGYGVIDAGVDVSAEKFIDLCKTNSVDAVGISSFTTAGKKIVKEIATKLKKEFKNQCPLIMAGGPSIKGEDIKKLNIDGYADDMVEAVEVFENLIKTRQNPKSH
ncbi:MAG: hypothetical protein D6734_03635 [Candidatus Schekmanbacteria bacterium]|nr:MAG: hypothetical protein D6734_03635 [Candidatus Schekmanbacteria bacterium]